MRYISTLLFLMAFTASGCGGELNHLASGKTFVSADEAYLAATDIARRRDTGNNTFPDDQGGAVVSKDNFKTLVQFNHVLSNQFLLAADNSRKLGKYGNATLILAAVLYGIGNTNGVDTSTLNNGLIVGLGLSEAIHYSGANESSSAFLAAAEQSSCIAGRGADRMSETSVATEVDAHELWEAMTIVQADLRRNLRRKPISFLTLATGLLNPSTHNTGDYALSRAEQRLRAHTKQNSIEPKGTTQAVQTLRYKLLDCITQKTAGDT
jgi:hypothetical protein